MIFNDAKLCYDRIVLWIAPLSLRRLGASRKATIEMMDTLQGTSHKVCNSYGDSDIFYEGTLWNLLQGVGQGNGVGPAIWVAISTVLLMIMNTKGFGFSLLSDLSLSALAIAAFDFLYDTDIFYSALDPYCDSSDTLK